MKKRKWVKCPPDLQVNLRADYGHVFVIKLPSSEIRGVRKNCRLSRCLYLNLGFWLIFVFWHMTLFGG